MGVVLVKMVKSVRAEAMIKMQNAGDIHIWGR